MSAENKCCKEPDYQFHLQKLEKHSYDTLRQVEYYFCANCGHVAIIGESRPKKKKK